MPSNSAFFDLITVFGFLALAVATLLYLWQLHRLLASMQDTQPKLYASLGSPTLFVRNSPAATANVMRFLLGDPDRDEVPATLRREVKQVRALLVLSLAALATCLLWTVYGWTANP